jgi:FtsH-binding integral membrane protein
MKKLLIPAVIIAAIVLLYEQSKAAPNLYISVASIVVFMFLLYKLNARIPHKNDTTKDTDDVQ